jgi:protocatechuate 3,4-dioxygenase alpha subunit
MLAQSPSQTIGPFFHFGLIFGGENVLVRPRTRGPRIVFTGRILDGNREAVTDAMVEIWQADAGGIYAHPGDSRHAQADPEFHGFGRSDTAHPGDTFRFETIKPGAVKENGGATLAPHVCVTIFARGLLTHLTTRIYFGDEAAANAVDPILATVPAERRSTLVAMRGSESGAAAEYRLDIVLQGQGETVFFQP